MQRVEYEKAGLAQHQKSDAHSRIQEYKGNRSSNYLSTGQSTTSILDQQLSPINETGLCSTLPLCSPPLCRQFWKAGNYEDGLASKSTLQNGSSYLHIHPKFLHSNATSHKWAFGAIAELLDNAVDEIQNGATFVLVDKTLNPRDGRPALLIQDNGGGMDLEAMRCCLSFGFSDKKSKSTIGQYGNGFKTSTMRLGADVVVFSRHLKERCSKSPDATLRCNKVALPTAPLRQHHYCRKLTQSIGLLSYTFLTQTGHDRIVIPMVDYEFDTSTGALKTSDRHGKEHFISNLSMLLQWSPYSTEADLLQQFDDIGYCGTKVIIYNLWLNNDGTVELDFDSDPEDIRLSGDANHMENSINQMAISGQHMANQLRYSLRVYLSILYLRVPESFSIILRGRVVEYHNIASDLKFPEFILYRPQNGGRTEGTVVTTIGFLKEAPHVNIRGFNVYHKNRLILPFWHVVSYNDSRGRGVVGVLEANFIEPTHNKQDFEKTSVFQKLENRLKEMTWEYWDYHCGLLGYQVKKKLRTLMPSLGSTDSRPHNFMQQPVVSNKSSSRAASTRALPTGEQLKRKECQYLAETEQMRKRAGGGVDKIATGINPEMQPALATGNQLEDPKAIKLIQENKRLRALCLEHEKREEELSVKVTELRRKLGELQRVYSELLTESGLILGQRPGR